MYDSVGDCHQLCGGHERLSFKGCVQSRHDYSFATSAKLGASVCDVGKKLAFLDGDGVVVAALHCVE